MRKRSLQISSKELVNCVNNKSRTTNSEKLSVSLDKNRDYELRFYICFYGEFDPGSERTLAAWIRHASRTGLYVVAILYKV